MGVGTGEGRHVQRGTAPDWTCHSVCSVGHTFRFDLLRRVFGLPCWDMDWGERNICIGLGHRIIMRVGLHV